MTEPMSWDHGQPRAGTIRIDLCLEIDDSIRLAWELGNSWLEAQMSVSDSRVYSIKC